MRITLAEAEQILRAGLRATTGSDAAYETADNAQRVNMAQGVLGVVAGLEALGYRIAPPLRQVNP